MKHLSARATLVGLATAIVTTAAYADSFSTSFVIGKLNNNITSTLVNDSLLVEPETGSMYNPGGCSSSSYATIHPSVSQAGKDLMNKLLTSAFLAGRKVKLRISTSSCNGGNPNYTAVEVNSTE
jgi:hypothetical protein